MVELVDGLNLTTDIEVLNIVVEVLDGGVVLITAKDQLGFLGPKTRGQFYPRQQTHKASVPPPLAG